MTSALIKKVISKIKNEEKMKTLLENKWLSLKQVGNYIFSHETRSNGKILALLVFDSSRPGMYFGRYENTPCHFDGIQLASITGGVEKDEIIKTAILELKEEAGFVGKEEDLISLGTVRPTKSTDTVVYLFAFDANGKQAVKAEGDGSEGEVGAYCSWVTEQACVQCKDPLMVTLVSRFKSR